MKYYLITAAAAAAMLAGAAGAGNDVGKAAWTTLDGDRDGVITRSEAQGSAALTEKFDSYDVNRDGALSKKEFEASQNTMPAPATSKVPAKAP